jgi:hypothetical protein
MKAKLLRKLRRKASRLVDYQISYANHYYAIYLKRSWRDRRTLLFGEFYQGMTDFVLNKLYEAREMAVFILADEIRSKRKKRVK